MLTQKLKNGKIENIQNHFEESKSVETQKNIETYSCCVRNEEQ
jgi:hypothetical protein